jgi:hypothetical protein
MPASEQLLPGCGVIEALGGLGHVANVYAGESLRDIVGWLAMHNGKGRAMSTDEAGAAPLHTGLDACSPPSASRWPEVVSHRRPPCEANPVVQEAL